MRDAERKHGFLLYSRETVYDHDSLTAPPGNCEVRMKGDSNTIAAIRMVPMSDCDCKGNCVGDCG